MTSQAVAPSTYQRVAKLWQTPLGKKAVMAVTGVILFGFVLAHMIGNLQVYMGPEKLNSYARFLRSLGSLLWIARGILLLAVLLHIWSAVSLVRLSLSARPVSYKMRGNVNSSYASRTMKWSGFILLAYIVYHLMHFTFGNAHPNFVHLDVYHNFVTGFRQVPVTIVYVVANLLLGMHIYHGFYSMFQSLGLTHPSYTPRIKAGAFLFAFVVTAGNVAMPISVVAGVIK